MHPIMQQSCLLHSVIKGVSVKLVALASHQGRM